MANVNSTFGLVLIAIALIMMPGVTSAQDDGLEFYHRKHKGFGLVTSDSIFSFNFQFRMQNRAAVVTKGLDDLAAESFEFRVRRLRLKFGGFVYNPKLTYYIQLSVSRGDMDWYGPDNSTNNSSPNVVRDAVIYYSPTENLLIGFGQTKLPGNRQRVISSGDQQFVDRSLVNATFNLDRDFGFFAHLTSHYIILRGAVTSGEGRNSVMSNNGLAYTGRIEFLPFGRFTEGNDYVEGDLEREPTPKVSLAGTFSYNENAVREAGQRGNDLYQPRSIRNIEFDALLKYNGWAFYNEYMERNVANPVTVHPASSTPRFIFVGRGLLSQVSYLFRNNFEIAARYASVTPLRSMYDNPLFSELSEPRIEHIQFGVTRYLVGHRLKIQANLLREERTNMIDNSPNGGYWSGIFQVELGI